jgi:hypothetical protein
MSRETIVIRGEVYLTLEALADCYRVEVAWLHEVYELGLLGDGERVGATTVVSATMLDRTARILRLHLQQGVDLMGILGLLAEDARLGAGS